MDDVGYLLLIQCITILDLVRGSQHQHIVRVWGKLIIFMVFGIYVEHCIIVFFDIPHINLKYLSIHDSMSVIPIS